MTNDLEIRNVILSEDPFPDHPDHREQYHGLRVTVRNQSANRTIFVNEDARYITYDRETRSLIIGFQDEPTPESRVTSLGFHEPHQVAIECGQELVIEVPVARRFMNINTRAPRGKNVEEVDITALEHVVCRIAYDTVPFRPTGQARSGLHKHQEFAKWGQRTEGRFSVGNSRFSELERSI